LIGALRNEEVHSSWLEDALGEYADAMVEKWKKGNPASEDIAEAISIAWGGHNHEYK
jgi:hypothetical protein